MIGYHPKEWQIVALITCVALGVRLWGISHGLPYVYIPDEAQIVNHALAFGTGDLNPHWFVWPSLQMYVMFFLYGVYYIFGLLLGIFHSVDDFAKLFFSDPSFFYITGRLFSALLGTASIPLVYFLAKNIYDSQVGLVASLFLSFSFAHATEYSHIIKGINPAGFVGGLSLLLIYEIFQYGKTGRYILAGLVAGLAMSFRYEAAFLVVPLFLAHTLLVVNSKGTLRSLFLSRNLILGYMGFAAGFLIGTPFALFDLKTFVNDLANVSATFSSPGSVRHSGELYYLLTLRTTMGDVLAFLSVAGVFYGLYSHKPGDLILASFPVALGVFLSAFTVKEAGLMVIVFGYSAL